METVAIILNSTIFDKKTTFLNQNDHFRSNCMPLVPTKKNDVDRIRISAWKSTFYANLNHFRSENSIFCIRVPHKGISEKRLSPISVTIIKTSHWFEIVNPNFVKGRVVKNFIWKKVPPDRKIKFTDKSLKIDKK